MNCPHGRLLTNEQFHHLGLSNDGRRYEDSGRYLITKDPHDVGALSESVFRVGPSPLPGMSPAP